MKKMIAVCAWVISCALPIGAGAESPVLQVQYAEKFSRAVKLLDEYRGDTSALEAARAELNTVLTADPRYAPAYREMARYFIMRGHISGRRFESGSLEAADSAIRKALELNPDYAEAYVLRGHLYRLMGRHQDAVTALERAERLGTADPWLQNNWADLLIDEGKYEEAAKRYGKVLDSKTPNSKAMVSAFEGLIRYYNGTGQIEQADEIYRKRIALEPGAAWGYGNYARFLLCSRDDYENAILRSRQALAIMNYGVARHWLAAALYRKWAQAVIDGRSQEGQPYYAEAQTIYADPNYLAPDAEDCPPLNRIGDALIRINHGTNPMF